MLGIGHQTVFNLCVGLILLAAVSVVCVALLFLERQDMAVLQRNIDSLEQENAMLRQRLEPTGRTRPGDHSTRTMLVK